MDVAVHVFGVAGLVETVMELAYVASYQERFTAFEEVFFLASVSFEIGAELLFLCVGYCLLRRHSNRRTTAKALAKDPVHHIAAVATDAAEETSWGVSALSLAAMTVSLLPLLAWATFFPVWGQSFGGGEGGDGDGGDIGGEGKGGGGATERLVLSVCSLVGVVAFAALGARARAASSVLGRQRSMDVLVALGMVLYALQKCFQVYFLLSNRRRLCQGLLGKALVAFQSFEVLSVAIVVVALLSISRHES